VNVGLNLKKPLGAFQRDISESQIRLRSVLPSLPGAKIACVLTGGNVNLEQLKGLRWN